MSTIERGRRQFPPSCLPSSYASSTAYRQTFTVEKRFGSTNHSAPNPAKLHPHPFRYFISNPPATSLYTISSSLTITASLYALRKYTQFDNVYFHCTTIRPTQENSWISSVRSFDRVARSQAHQQKIVTNNTILTKTLFWVFCCFHIGVRPARIRTIYRVFVFTQTSPTIIQD